MSTTTETNTASTANPPNAEEMREVLAKIADFMQLAPASVVPAGPGMDFIQDVPITITARLGQTVMPIGEILKLGPGAVVELDREITQPIELTVRGMVFARGEVVVVDDRFAVRIKELMPTNKIRGKG
jgi:flagellar motor switch protein FliN